MDFPFGGHHHHHHHGHQRPEEDPNPNPNPYPDPNPYPNPNPYPPPGRNPYEHPAPPPPYYGGAPPPPHVPHASHEYGYAPPPPHVQHVSHEAGGGGGYGYGNQMPAAAAAAAGGYLPHVQHVSHEAGGGGGYGYGNQMPPAAAAGYFPHVEHVSHEGRPHGGELPRQPTVRVYTKADENYSLSIRDGNVVLVPSNPRDDYQHWIKDLKYSTRVKDEEGLPSFALINKVTGQAIKHAIKTTHPVRLVPYNPDYLDESVLWTESKDTGEGFRCIRMVNNIRSNFDAFHGDEDHGGVRDGTPIVLWEWLKGKNQRWKIAPYCKFSQFLIFYMFISLAYLNF